MKKILFFMLFLIMLSFSVSASISEKEIYKKIIETAQFECISSDNIGCNIGDSDRINLDLAQSIKLIDYYKAGYPYFRNLDELIEKIGWSLGEEISDVVSDYLLKNNYLANVPSIDNMEAWGFGWTDCTDISTEKSCDMICSDLGLISAPYCVVEVEWEPTYQCMIYFGNSNCNERNIFFSFAIDDCNKKYQRSRGEIRCCCGPSLPTDFDFDQDGYADKDDCVVYDSSINPGVDERCDDEIDNNCDGLIDDEDPTCVIVEDPNFSWTECLNLQGKNCNILCEERNLEADKKCVSGRGNLVCREMWGGGGCGDDDIYLSNGGSSCSDEIIQHDADWKCCCGISSAPDLDNDGFNSDYDCDDNNPNINSDSVEICDDNLDNDCDGVIDQFDSDCSENNLDLDEDGFSIQEGDCDDNNPQVNPGKTEICGDILDNDCDGITDCESDYSNFFIFTPQIGTYDFNSLKEVDQKCFEYVNSIDFKNKMGRSFLENEVYSFLCNDSFCNNLKHNSNFQFAVLGDIESGGDFFKTDSDGLMIYEDGTWASPGKFNGEVSYWTGRESKRNWRTPEGSWSLEGDHDTCEGLKNMGTINRDWEIWGAIGESKFGGSNLWSGHSSCQSDHNIICVVEWDLENYNTDDSDNDGFSIKEGDCDDNNNLLSPGTPENCYDGVSNNCNDLKDFEDSDCYINGPNEGRIFPETGNEYKLFKDLVLFEDAILNCESLGSHLVTITSENEDYFMASFFGLTPVKFHIFDVENIFIGLKRERDGREWGDWQWVTGEIVDYNRARDTWGTSNKAYLEWGYYENDLEKGRYPRIQWGNSAQTTLESYYICEWESGSGIVDQDNDGYGFDVDCDDNNFEVNPSAEETCYDFIDNNCNGEIDEDCEEQYIDEDEDGFSVEDGDCDDSNPKLNPDSEELCYDGIDNDCDNLIDTDDECTYEPQFCEDCAKGMWHICSEEECLAIGDCEYDSGSLTEKCNTIIPYIDNDNDYFSIDEGDCDDDNSEVYPGQQEVCDGVDNDCDGLVDEVCGGICDTDEDGHNEKGIAFFWCPSPRDDCDDGNPNRYPGNKEICDDGIDNDCDVLPDLQDADCKNFGTATLKVTAYYEDGSIAPRSKILIDGKMLTENGFFEGEVDSGSRTLYFSDISGGTEYTVDPYYFDRAHDDYYVCNDAGTTNFNDYSLTSYSRKSIAKQKSEVCQNWIQLDHEYFVSGGGEYDVGFLNRFGIYPDAVPKQRSQRITLEPGETKEIVIKYDASGNYYVMTPLGAKTKGMLPMTNGDFASSGDSRSNLMLRYEKNYDNNDNGDDVWNFLRVKGKIIEQEDQYNNLKVVHIKDYFYLEPTVDRYTLTNLNQYILKEPHQGTDGTYSSEEVYKIYYTTRKNTEYESGMSHTREELKESCNPVKYLREEPSCSGNNYLVGKTKYYTKYTPKKVNGDNSMYTCQPYDYDKFESEEFCSYTKYKQCTEEFGAPHCLTDSDRQALCTDPNECTTFGAKQCISSDDTKYQTCTAKDGYKTSSCMVWTDGNCPTNSKCDLLGSKETNPWSRVPCVCEDGLLMNPFNWCE